MMVVSRKAQETLVIDGGRIVLTVVRIDQNKVRIGITAPPDVRVDRGEVAARIAAEAAFAANCYPADAIAPFAPEAK